MVAVKRLGHGVTERTRLEAARKHRRPGHGLEQGPMSADSGDERENDQKFTEP